MTQAPNIQSVLAIEDTDKRQHFIDVRHVTVRWEPYKPDGRRQMKAKGRWQEQVGCGDYWRWQNCDRPAFAHDPDPMSHPVVEQMLEALHQCVGALKALGAEQGAAATFACATIDKAQGGGA